MIKNFEIINPQIFSNELITAGVTKRNQAMFPPDGFSIRHTNAIDNDESLRERLFLAEFLETDIENLKFQYQTHSSIIRIIGLQSATVEADALVSAEKGIFLCVKIADCAAVLLYDTVNEVIAAIHSGWRGTYQNICAKTIAMMNSNFNTEPENLLSYISPSASGANYEVGSEFINYFNDCLSPLGNGKYLFDNKMKIHHQLLEAGVLESNIEVSDACTIADQDLHSFRRDGIKAGRMVTYISMNL